MRWILSRIRSVVRTTQLVSWLLLVLMFGLISQTARAAAEGRPCSPEPTDMTIGYGDLIICQIEAVGDTDVFRFAGAAGEMAHIHVSAQAGGPPCVLVRDPDGTQAAASCNYGSTAALVKLAKTGYYTIQAYQSGMNATMTYALSLERLSPPSPAATLIRFAQNLSDEINPVGDVDLFLFGGIAGDTVIVSVSGVSGGPPCVLVSDPEGTQVGASCNYGSTGTTVKLPKNGTYTAEVTQSGMNATMTYRIDLQCVGQCPSLPFPTVSVTLTGCTACRAGDLFSARVAMNNAGSPARPSELKLGFYLPDGTPANLADPHLELPVNFTFDGEFVRAPITASYAQGTWRLCGRLLELQLGQVLAESCPIFTIGP